MPRDFQPRLGLLLLPLALALAGPTALGAQASPSPIDAGDVYVGGAYWNLGNYYDFSVDFDVPMWGGWIGTKTGQRTRLVGTVWNMSQDLSTSVARSESDFWQVSAGFGYDLLDGPAVLEVLTSVGYGSFSQRTSRFGGQTLETSADGFFNSGQLQLGYSLGSGDFSLTPHATGLLYSVSTSGGQISESGATTGRFGGTDSRFGPRVVTLGATVELFDTFLLGLSWPGIDVDPDREFASPSRPFWHTTLAF